MVKRGKTIQINLSNRLLYTIIAIGVLLIAGVGVYALTPGTAPNPGHTIDTIAPPTGCGDGEFLQFVDATIGWGCTTPSAGGIETDPTVLTSVKDGVSWTEVTGKPTSFPTLIGDNLNMGEAGFTALIYAEAASCVRGETKIRHNDNLYGGYGGSDMFCFCAQYYDNYLAWYCIGAS